MKYFNGFFDYSFLGNTLEQYMIAAGVFLGLAIAFKVFQYYVLKNIKKLAKKTKTDIDDEFVRLAEEMPQFFYWYFSFYIALQFISVNHITGKIAYVFLIIILIYWATKAASDIIEYLLNKLIYKKKADEQKKEKTTTYYALSILAKILLWSTGFLLILSNLGVNISALVASLGIGGIAVALAVQNILSDIFSSFSIYFDKPFEVGDFVIIGEHMGVVKRIGLKTTRLTALQGEEIVISNRELTSVRIQNFKKMKKRRILFTFGVIYSTTMKQLKKINDIVEKVIRKAKFADLDRVHFKNFGESSLNFEVVYYLNSGDYNEYMDTQQEINWGIKEYFDKEEIEMAFPTQTVYLQK